MLYDQRKQQELQKARARDQRKKARETLKKNSVGKNKGLTKKTIRDAKNLAKDFSTHWGIFSLATKISLADWMYFAALLAAIFKDIVDLIEAAGVTYIVVFVVTLCISAFIAMMMFLGSFSSGKSRTQYKIIRGWLILLGGTGAEMIFGLNFMPIETFTVILIWGMVLSERKQAEKEKEEKRHLETNEAEAYA